MLSKHSKFMTYLLLLIASVDIMGWLFHHDTLLAWMPWFTTMTFNTAVGFVCLSLAILLFRHQSVLSNHIARFLLLSWGLFASVSLAQDVFQVNLGLHQMDAGRMSQLTSLGFIISCWLLIQLHYFKHKNIINHTLILLLSLLVLFGLSLYVLHRHAAHIWVDVASISIMTLISFCLIIWIALALFQASNPKHSLWLHSGIQVMYRLSYPQKFVLISLVMLIPLFVLMMMKWQDLNASIQHSELELVGIEHLQKTSQLALAIAKHRGMSHAHFENTALFQEELSEEKIHINEMFARHELMDQHNEHAISIPKEWKSVLAMWHRIQQENIQVEESWQLHSRLIKLLEEHLGVISRESLLSYDHVPLLQDLVTFQWMILPELVENLGQIRGQGAGLLTKNHINPNNILNINMLKSQIRFLLHESEEVLSHVWKNGHKPRLHQSYQQFQQKTKNFIALNISRQSHLNAETYFQQGTDTIQSVSAFNQMSLAYVQQQLVQRTDNNLTEKYWLSVTALWVILLILYLFISFYQSVMLTIQSLQDATERMRKGDMNILSESPTQDELGYVVASFNTIAQELLQTTKRMHAMVEYAVDGIVTIQASGEIAHVNAAAESIFTYHKSELVGKNVTCLMPERFRQKHKNGLEHYLKTGEQVVFGCILEVEGLRKNGETFPMTLSINEMKLDGEHMFVAMMRDISQYKKLEKQVRQSEKTEAIGELVAGVAHNFNNMLSAIGGKTYLAQAHLQKNPQHISKYLDSIEGIVEQAASMIQQLLIFSKQDFLKHPSNLSINNLIHDVYSKSLLDLPSDVSLTLTLLEDDVSVYADYEQLKQVILEILNNAIDAVSESDAKNIDFNIRLADLNDDFYQRHQHLKKTRYVCLTMSDTGHGMSEDIQSHIFDPFYSTKEVGKGTGLGLSSVLGSIDSHKGVIEVESEPLVGTSFHIYLPLIEVATSRLQETHVDAVVAEKQYGILLLVGDDSMGIEAYQEILEDLVGYQVLLASHGEQGLQRFEEQQEHITAVVTNVMMPTMGGVQMMQKIRQISPNLPVVYSD